MECLKHVETVVESIEVKQGLMEPPPEQSPAHARDGCIEDAQKRALHLSPAKGFS
jgi:hypothetical protein